MACNRCGQNGCNCAVGAYSCPKLSNPPKCDELRNLKDEMMDELDANRNYVSGCNPESIVKYIDSITDRASCLNDQEINALCSIYESIAKLNNTDVGNHLSALTAGGGNYSHTVTGTLTRKKLDGTTQTSDVKTATIDLTYIKNAIDSINSKIDQIRGGDIETTETLWTGNISEGNAIPITLTTGTYDIGVHSNDIGAYVVRIIWSAQSPINHNSIISPYVPADSDGSFWIMQPKLTNATRPVFRVTLVKYDHSTQSSSVSNSNNGCQITSVKRVVVKRIG